MRLRHGTVSLLAALLLGGAELSYAAAPQAAPAPPKAGAPAARAPARRRAPRRPRVQTTPTRERIVEIQTALAREGFYAGKPTGRWDAVTSEAMRKFQTANGLTPTGKLGAQSLQKLGLGSEIAGRGAPLPQADAGASVLSESELLASDPEQP